MNQSIKKNSTNEIRIIFLGGILIFLLLLVCCKANSLSSVNTISSEAAEEMVREADPQYRDVNFGGKFVLCGAKLIKGTEGMRIELVWRSPMEQPLTYSNAIHLLDRQGTILSTLDYPQDRRKNIVRAETLWIDKIDIPASRLDNIAFIGIGIYSLPDIQLLSVDKGPRDWGGKRLLMALPSITAIKSNIATEVVSQIALDYREIIFKINSILQTSQFIYNAPEILFIMLILGVILRLLQTKKSLFYQLQLSTIGFGFTLLLWSHDALLFSLWFILTFILMHLFTKPVRVAILCIAYMCSIFYFRKEAGNALDSMIWACPLQLQLIRSIDIVTAEADLHKPFFMRLLQFTSYLGTPVNVNHWYYVRYRDWISHLEQFNGLPAIRDNYVPLLKRAGWIVLLLIASVLVRKVHTTYNAANSFIIYTGYKAIHLLVFWPLMNHLLFLGADWINTPGIELCRQPVLTSSPIDFWRRQQLGIATFFREKVYDQFWGGTRSRYRNLFYTFVLIGFWHSLTFQWMIWGILWGSVMVINRYYRQTFKKSVMEFFRHVPWLYYAICWLTTMFMLAYFDFIVTSNIIYIR